MVRELGGTAEIQYLSSGVVFEVVAPLPDLAEEATIMSAGVLGDSL